MGYIINFIFCFLNTVHLLVDFKSKNFDANIFRESSIVKKSYRLNRVFDSFSSKSFGYHCPLFNVKTNESCC